MYFKLGKMLGFRTIVCFITVSVTGLIKGKFYILCRWRSNVTSYSGSGTSSKILSEDVFPETIRVYDAGLMKYQKIQWCVNLSLLLQY